MNSSKMYPKPHAQTAGRVIDEEAVLILSDDSQIKVLNPVGSRIYALADGTRSVAAIAAVIAEEYDVTAEESERDVLSFLQHLVDQRVMIMQDATE